MISKMLHQYRTTYIHVNCSSSIDNNNGVTFSVKEIDNKRVMKNGQSIRKLCETLEQMSLVRKYFVLHDVFTRQINVGWSFSLQNQHSMSKEKSHGGSIYQCPRCGMLTVLEIAPIERIREIKISVLFTTNQPEYTQTVLDFIFVLELIEKWTQPHWKIY